MKKLSFTELARDIAPMLDTPIEAGILHLYAGRASLKPESFGKFYPSRETTAAQMRCSVDAVDRANQKFKALGILTWNRGFGNQHTKRSNKYHFNVEKLRELAEKARSATPQGCGLPERSATPQIDSATPQIDSATPQGCGPNNQLEQPKELEQPMKDSGFLNSETDHDDHDHEEEKLMLPPTASDQQGTAVSADPARPATTKENAARVDSADLAPDELALIREHIEATKRLEAARSGSTAPTTPPAMEYIEA